MTHIQTNNETPLNEFPSQTQKGAQQNSSLLKGFILGLSLLTFSSFGLLGLDQAEANPENHNSAMIKNVLLEPEPGIALTLKNTSESHYVSQATIEPTTNYLTLGLTGYVQCEPEVFPPWEGWEPYEAGEVNSNASGSSARNYYGTSYVTWGTVFLDGIEIQAWEALYSAPHHPTVYGYGVLDEPGGQAPPQDGPGYDNPWTESVGDNAPFLVSLDKIKNGSANIRFRPVDEFNKLLDAMEQEGISRLTALQQDHTFSVIRPISLTGFCNNLIGLPILEGTPNWLGAGYHTVNVAVTVKYKGDPDLKPEPVGAGDHPSNEAVPFQVSSASVETQLYDKNYEGVCPTELDFGVTLNVVGQGMVEYRMVNFLGGKSPIYQAWFENGGTKFEVFSHQVGENSVGGFEGEAADDILNPFQPAGPIDGKAIAPSDKQFDSWRIEIVSPNTLVSDEEFYNWTCTPAPADVDGPDGLDGPSPHPTSRTESGGLTAN